MGSGIGETVTQWNESCIRDLSTPLEVRNRFAILDEKEERDAVVETGVSPSGAPAETTTRCEDPSRGS